MPDPNKIEGGKWDRVLRGIFNLKGAGATSARISDDISPTFNFPYRSEHDFLIGDKLLFAEGSSGPVALENPRIILTNAGENTLLILDKIIFSGAAGGNPFFGVSSAAQPFVAATLIQVRDGQWGPMQTDVGSGSSRFQDATLVGAPTPRGVRFGVDIKDHVFFPNVILAPNDHAFMSNATVASFLIATFFWREHKMEPTQVA